MKPSCPICGPKLTICCMVLSAWGIIFLLLLGVFFYVKSTALLADLAINKTIESFDMTTINSAYVQQAYNCWVAAALYVVTLIIAVWQNRMGSMRSSSM